MKRKVFLLTGLISIVAASFAFGVYAASDIKLIINGKSISTDVQMVKGSVYVPLRVVSETLGADVKWDATTRTATIMSKGSTGSTTGTPPDTTPQSVVKLYTVDVNLESGPMKLNISKVTLDPSYKKDDYSQPVNALILDVSVENTSADTVSWFPSQGTIATNTKEQIDADTFTSDQVSGEFMGKVIKTGKIVFAVKGDLTQIDSFTFKVTGASNPTTFASVGDDKTTDVLLK